MLPQFFKSGRFLSFYCPPTQNSCNLDMTKKISMFSYNLTCVCCRENERNTSNRCREAVLLPHIRVINLWLLAIANPFVSNKCNALCPQQHKNYYMQRTQMLMTLLFITLLLWTISLTCTATCKIFVCVCVTWLQEIFFCSLSVRLGVYWYTIFWSYSISKMHMGELSDEDWYF